MVATEFTDISPLYAGKAGKVIQVDPTEKGVEFGQALRATDSPQFEGMTVIGSFTVECDATFNAGLFVQNDAIFSATVDVEGSLNVTDNKITLNNKGTPSDLNADGGGLLLLGDIGSPKTISWLNGIKCWTFNQDVAIQKQLSIGALTAPAADASIDLKATNKGLLFNRLTTVQRDALTAVQGMVIYNTTLDDMEFFTGSVWKSMNSALVAGPASATDNAVVRYDGTSGKLTQNSGVTIDDAGNVVIPGDLTIQGTTVTLDATTLLVEDKNIELGSVAVPTDITADGGGITLKGATDKTILWTSATQSWDFNQKVIAQVGLQVIGDLNNFGLNGNPDSFAAGTGALDATTTASRNVAIGKNAGGSLLTGSDNYFLGFAAGGSATSSNFNVGIGKSSLTSLTTGDNNVAVGEQTLQAIKTTNRNTALGANALKKHVANDTVAVGFNALLNNTGGIQNTALGFEALGNNISTSGSTAVGHHAMKFTIAGFNTAVGADAMTGAVGLPTVAAVDNVAVGAGALNLLTSGSSNVAVGRLALSLSTNAKSNVAVGANALGVDTVGDFNVAIGHDALKSLTVADDNIAIGFAALQNVTTGIDNIGVGCFVGEGIVTGSRNILIGEEANFATDVSDMLNIGNSMFLSMATSNFLGLGVPSPTSSIHIQRAGQTEIALETYSAVNSIPVLSFKRSDGATVGTHAAVDAGDILGLIDFYGSNGTIFLSGAHILATAEETFIATSAATSLRFFTAPVGSVIPLERIAITPSGNVGIGVSAPDPSAKLEINGQIKITGGNPGNSRYLRSDPDGLATWGDIGWTDLGTDVVLLDGSNKVGIGTPTPDASAKLEVASTSRGFLSPRMTETQRDAISSPATGLKIYNTTVDKYEIFTGTVWKAFLTEDLGTVVAQETFASTNVRFFGELALPATQGWTDTATGSATIDLQTQLVFDVSKQVIRHNDNTTNGSTTSKIILTVQNWIDINNFGASYSGISRLDTVSGSSGFFSGLQANAAENPLATGNRRYGILFNSASGNLKLTEADNTGNNVIMDGTSGNPLITFDEWFRWECLVPAGLGAAQLFINGALTTFVPTFFVNGGGLGTQIIVSSGSTGGANRVVYHDNFGTTIFEESATRTLAAVTMAADIAQINIPEGKRDYTIILPDGNPRPIGSVLRLVANNLFGKITLENQNPAAPEILYNGLRTLVIDVFIKEIIGGINTVDQGNVYIGFKDEDIDRAESIFAQLSSSVDQVPVNTNPTVITYNTQDEINGIGHSTSLNPGELEILPGFGGVYFVSPQPQVGKDTGGVKTDFDMFWEIDRGSGFADEPNSNVRITIKDSDITTTASSAFAINLNVGDKIRMLQRVSNSTVGLGLKNTDPEVGPPTVPRTPSIILTMHRVGGAPA